MAGSDYVIVSSGGWTAHAKPRSAVMDMTIVIGDFLGWNDIAKVIKAV